MSDQEWGSVYSTLNQQLLWATTVFGQEATAPDGLELNQIAAGNMSLYVCLPSDQLAKFRGFLRLLTMAASAASGRSTAPAKTLFVLD